MNSNPHPQSRPNFGTFLLKELKSCCPRHWSCWWRRSSAVRLARLAREKPCAGFWSAWPQESCSQVHCSPTVLWVIFSTPMSLFFVVFFACHWFLLGIFDAAFFRPVPVKLENRAWVIQLKNVSQCKIFIPNGVSKYFFSPIQNCPKSQMD